MSDTNQPTGAGDVGGVTGGLVTDPIASIRGLAGEQTTRARTLRSGQIPQQIGMAAACRALAVELPRALAVQIDADLASGVLAQRWEAVKAAAAERGAHGDSDPTLLAIALLLREQGRSVMRQLVRREKEWTADAYRLEGQASALEGVAGQLLLMAGDNDASGSENDTATSSRDAIER